MIIAVQDRSTTPAARREDTHDAHAVVSGLAIVAALCTSWGSLPTESGKTVWALITPTDTRPQPRNTHHRLHS